ncbi:hypothetical protein RYH80_18060 [Halobaculum sp. MBLA0147]|uniref:hypothetical protein n=1 Tax=Halobaculum sp. MBLA0147 TaxID=3079934 RepID=UPI003523E174
MQRQVFVFVQGVGLPSLLALGVILLVTPSVEVLGDAAEVWGNSTAGADSGVEMDAGTALALFEALTTALSQVLTVGGFVASVSIGWKTLGKGGVVLAAMGALLTDVATLLITAVTVGAARADVGVFVLLLAATLLFWRYFPSQF